MRSGLCFVVFVVAVLCGSTFAYDWSTNPGDGSPQNPYQIAEPNQLIAIGANPDLLDKHFMLTNDIVFDPANNPAHVFTQALIAPDTDPIRPGFQGAPFSGTFHGGGKTISGFTCSNWTVGPSSGIGLFGFIKGTNGLAIVSDLSMENIRVNSIDDYVGGLAGAAENTLFRECTVQNGEIAGINRVGGLIGYSENVRLIACYSDVYVSGAEEVGGMLGWIYYGSVQNCRSKGNVFGANMVGGLVGRTGAAGSRMMAGDVPITVLWSGSIPDNQTVWINSSFTESYVSGKTCCGGLVGLHSGGMIERCYAKTSLGGREGGYSLGGLIGLLFQGTVLDSYAEIDLTWNSSISICYSIGGFCGWAQEAVIRHSCCTGFMSGPGTQSDWAEIGGFVGSVWDQSVFVDTCYYADHLPPDKQGAVSLTSTEMKTPASFVGWSFVGDANGNQAWRMCTDGVETPRLSWEFAQGGDFACPNGVDLVDMLALTDNWLTIEAIAPMLFNSACDANIDGQINLDDFSVLSENWQKNSE